MGIPLIFVLYYRTYYIENLEDKTDALVELNIIEQVNNLVKTSIVQKAWHVNQPLMLHGCVYGLKNGILKDLIIVDKNSTIDPLYQFDFDNSLED